MENLDQLYGEIIMEHQREPRHHGHLTPCDCEEEGFNPLCGDKVVMTFRFDDEKGAIKEVAFEGQGCSISMASSSILMEELQGKTYEAALAEIEKFRELMQGTRDPETMEGDVKALAGVKRFPVRIKCALLAWMTAKKAIESRGEGGAP
jgi:nitrogen fixation NifU-like protein